MTDHPMSLEFDWASNAYRARLGDALMSIEHSFETLAAARHALRLVGLRLGAKTDPRTWRIELLELGLPEGDIVSSAALSDFCAPLSIGFNRVFGRGKP
jgi:hypothetical protein